MAHGIAAGDITAWNAKQVAYANLTNIGGVANTAGWLHNDGSGGFTYSTPTGTAYTASSPLAIDGSNNITIAQANTTTSGYLTYTDWNTFNGKVATSDLTAYALLAGRSGGQVLKGGTVANDALVLQANSATSGDTLTNIGMQFKVGDSGSTNALTILNNGNVGFGSTAPSQFLSVGATNQFTVDSAGNVQGASFNGNLISGSATLSLSTFTLTLTGNTQINQDLLTTSGVTFANVTDSALSNGVVINSAGLLGSEAQLAIARGGTGTSTAPTDGQLLIGTSGGAYAVAGITASSGISVTPGSGSIVITNTGVRSLLGTTDRVTVSAASGDNVTLSLPQSIATTSSPTFQSLTLSNALSVANGGTGLNSAGSANQIIGMNAAGTAMEYKTVSGTTHQVTVTNTANALTFSLPQNIDSTASPSFAGLTISGLTAGYVPFIGTGGVVSQDVGNFFYNSTNHFLGLGTITPNSQLEVYSSSDNSILTLTAASASYDPLMKFRTGATPTVQFSMGVDTADSNKFKIYSGDGIAGTNEFSIDTSGLTSIANLQMGAMVFDTDAGAISWIDMPVVSAVSGTVESYTAQLDGNPMLTIYGKSDGAGGANTLGIGLGTVSPVEMLDVNGRVHLTQTTAPTTTTDRLYNVSGNLVWNGTNLTAGGALPSGTEGQTLYSNAGVWTANSTLFYDDVNARVGVGTATPSALFSVGASNQFTVNTSGNVVGGTYNGLTLTSATDGFTVAGGTTSRTLTVTGGDVSINQNLLTTSSPTFAGLTISGLTTGSVPFIGAGGVVSQNNTNFFWDNANNRLGLGTATPSYQLDIAGASGIANLFRISSAGSDVLSVTNAQTTFSNPVNFAAAGDVSIANNLIMTNSTAGNLNFQGPGYIATTSSWQNLDLTLAAANSGQVIVDDNLNVTGSIGIGTASPTAYLNIAAGTATAGTAPLKFTSGINLTTTEAGAMEYNGSHLYFTATNGGTRFQLDQQGNVTNPMTTLGDIIYGGASGAPTALAGSAGFLTSTGAAAPAWTAKTTDYFTQYALLAGRSGGQSLIGGTAQDNALILQSNSYSSNTLTNIGMQFNVGNSGATNALTILNNGNVGIGTTSPSSKLTVTDNNRDITSALSNVLINANDSQAAGRGGSLQFGGIYTGTSYITFAGIKGAKENSTDANTAGELSLYTRPNAGAMTERLRIDSTGNVGIGTTAPSNVLDVRKQTTAAGDIMAIGDITSGRALIFGQGSSGSYGYISTALNDATQGIVIKSGNVGIGTMAPGARLSVVGADSLSTSFAANISGATGTGLVVANNGNVGIGTTAPGAKLQITSIVDNEIALKIVPYRSDNIITVNKYGTLGMLQPSSAGENSAFGLSATSGDTTGRLSFGLNSGNPYLSFGDGTNARDVSITRTGANNLSITGNVGIGTTAPSQLLSVGASNQFTVNTSGNVVGGTYNGLTLTSAADGFTVAGGTTSRTLTVTGGAFTVNGGGNTLTMTGSASLNQSLLTSSTPSFAGLTLTGALTLNDDQLLNIGTSGAGVIMNRSTSLTANTTLANVILGTPTVGAIIAGSTIFANTTSGADMVFIGNNGGNSTELMRLSSATSQVAIGAGATSMTIDNNGNVGIGTVTPGYILDVQAASSKINSKNGYLTNGADYAEYFYTDNTDLQAGEAVCMDLTKPNAVKRCDRSGDNNVMGIVSTNPSIVGNGDGVARDNDPHYKIIGMIGQVSAKISGTDGDIKVGDSLTASTTAGLLRRANAGESTVGVAMQNSTDAKDGQIQVLISRRNQSLTVEKVEEAVTQNIATMNIQDQVNTMIANAQASLQAQTENLTLKTDQNVTNLLGLQTSVDNNLTIISGRLDSQDQILTNLTNQIQSLTTTQASNNTLIKDLQDQMELLKTQNQAVIDFATALNMDALIYKDTLGNLDLGDGQLEAGGVVAGAFTVKVTDAKKKTIGSNYIEVANDTNDGQSFFVKTTAVTDSCVILTNFQANPNAYSWVEKIKDENGKYIGFKIHLSQPTTQRIYFDWWIVEKDDKTKSADVPTSVSTEVSTSETMPSTDATTTTDTAATADTVTP